MAGRLAAANVGISMVSRQERAKEVRVARTAPRKPRGPTDLSKRSWWAVGKRTVTEFRKDGLSDWAASLTYYSVMSIFPAIIVLTALLGVLGPSAITTLIDNLDELGPGQARDLVVNALRELEGSQGLSGVVAIFGLAVALWSASSYVGAFMRAANDIYEIPEGRPLWKTAPLRVVLTVAMVVLMALTAIGVLVTGRLADRIGNVLGVGSVGVQIWDIVKWPVLAILVSLALALLYWAAPNVRQLGFRWLSPGSVLAVVLWVLASGGFAFYVANFGSYNKTYGSLASVVVFLVWLWISNLAVLLGLVFDAELARGREVAAGKPVEEEPFLPPRDTRAAPEKAKDGQDGLRS
jgi:membrane protein